jgi:catechol 2,3-dioxygenase-like lactoylglutathione lyase family enzyme
MPAEAGSHPSHPLELLGLDHVVLRVADLAALTRWYVAVLGCRVERVLPDFGLTQLRAGRSLIDLVDVARPAGAAGGDPAAGGRNLDHFCLRLAQFDAEAIQAHLQRHGVTFSAVERRYGADGHGPSLYLRDPEHNRIELKGPPDPDQQERVAEAITGPT